MADRVGQQLGNYRLLRLLGEGGFAQVYLGEQVYLKTLAAIKVLHTRLAQDDLEGFLSEARTIASLKHPRIVRVLDFGVEGGTPFLVMDFAPGSTLRERLPKVTQLSPVAILPMVQQITDALQYAHDRKLIHRDVKPENMLLDERQQIMLSDFGIATIAQSSRYQQTEGVAGTAAYMAPEQLRGRPRPASDQYSLGIVVYEWLAGARPFQGSFAEMASQHLFEPPPPLSEKLPAISPAVEQVVLRALAKDPTERFASVQDFAAAFEQASQERQSTRIRPTSELPSTLPAAAPPVTRPPKAPRMAEPPAPPLASTWHTPPRPAEPAPRLQRPAPPLAPTVRAAPPSTEPAPVPERFRARPWWVGGLLVGLVLVLVFVLMSRSPGGQGSPGAPVNGAAPTATMIPSATATPRPATGAVQEFAVPTPNSGPWRITAGPDGNLWFTEYPGHQIGRITPSGTITEFALPTPNSGSFGITAGPDGNLWFTECALDSNGFCIGGSKIGRITPSGTITEFAVPNADGLPDSSPWDITAGPDGNLWFTEIYGHQIERITPSGTITEFALPSANSGPWDITAGPDGNLWFTDCVGRGDCRGGGRIGRITPSGTITEFAVPTVAAWPESITPGPDGNLWFTECVFDSKGNCIDSKIGRITPSGNITEFCHLSENLARFSQITCPGLA